MRHDDARVHALKATLELRTGNSTPAGVIAQAEEFEAYIAADGKDTAQAPPPFGTQAMQETAGVRASRGR